MDGEKMDEESMAIAAMEKAMKQKMERSKKNSMDNMQTEAKSEKNKKDDKAEKKSMKKCSEDKDSDEETACMAVARKNKLKVANLEAMRFDGMFLVRDVKSGKNYTVSIN